MRIAINGFGRIGRGVLRALYESSYRLPQIDAQSVEIVAINEPADLATIVHLTKYDSMHGRFSGQVSADVANSELHIQHAQNSDTIEVSHHKNLNDVDWRDLNIDCLFECSGSADVEQLKSFSQRHPQSKVLFSRPMLKHEVDATLVFGVNHEQLKSKDTLISAGSCTTHAIVPVIKVLDENFGVEYGSSTTLHSLMNDQPVLDAYHHTNLRKTRAASHSMIPVNTDLAKGIGRLLPHLKGRFSAQAVRVPTLNVSAIDLTVTLKNAATVEAVNRCLQQASESFPAGVLAYTEELLASCDFNHCQDSAIIDAGQTRMSGDKLLKVWIWFDNEWAYAHRMLDISRHIVSLSK